jgi:hypothetical protein
VIQGNTRDCAGNATEIGDGCLNWGRAYLRKCDWTLGGVEFGELGVKANWHRKRCHRD